MSNHVNDQQPVCSINFVDRTIVAEPQFEQSGQRSSKCLGPCGFEIFRKPAKFAVDALCDYAVEALQVAGGLR